MPYNKQETPEEVRALAPIKQSLRQARSHRKQFEPGWEQNIAYAAGKHWVVYDRLGRTLRRIQDVDPRYRGKELYSADLITEYRTTVLGELGSDDDRPELLTINEDKTAEEFQRQLNRAVGFGWDNEWQGDSALAEADRLMVDLGTSAIRCRYDPTIGPTRAQGYPHMNGQPMGSEAYDQISQVVNMGMHPSEAGISYQDLKGSICWEPLSCFNILVPAGITHERSFPWEAVIRPIPLSMAADMFNIDPALLRADGDIKSTLGVAQESSSPGVSSAIGDTQQTRLQNHIWLTTYYEKPTRNSPQGRMIHFLGNDFKMAGTILPLPYEDTAGCPSSGIVYFHWWRVTGRFWSRSLVSALQDAQFTMDKVRTQYNELVDRSMPFVFIQKGSEAKKRSFLPFEEIEISSTEKQPQPVQGIGPGPWMSQQIDLIRQDAEHASGVKPPSLGDNPQNVTTYSQLALIKENDAIKRSTIMRERKDGIKRLIESSVYDMRKYWGSEKSIIMAGDEGMVESFIFNATQIPTQFMVKVARGTPKPRTQAAELQKIQDIAQYSLNSQQPLSVHWYYESIQNGQPMPLPDEPTNDHQDKALLENHMMLQGHPVTPADFDPPEVHIPLHRKAQIQCELVGNVQAFQIIEQHVQMHEQQAAINAAKQAQVQTMAGTPEGAPGGPPPSNPTSQGNVNG